jgi:membrane protein implicated in regulation of membrane protease activity
MGTFFLICAGVGGFFFLIKLIGMCFGADHGDADFSADHDFAVHEGDAGFRLLSVQSVAAFFLLFGLVGYAMLRVSKFPAGWAVTGASAAGLTAMVVIALVFMLFRRMQSSGTLDLANAVGQEGQVYLRIPPGGTGKVQVIVQGRQVILDAGSAGKDEIKSGDRVRITTVVGNSIVTVEKL